METIMLSVLEAERAVHVATDQGFVSGVMAALAADPYSLDDLRLATGRFADAAVRDAVFRRLADGVAEYSLDEGHLVIDLAARLITEEIAAGEIPRRGCVRLCSEQPDHELWLPYRVWDDWDWFGDWDQWRERAAGRRRQFAEHPPRDTRAVLYGGVVPWLVAAWLENEHFLHDPVLELQDRWLLTAREDLQGDTPRQVLLADRHRIECDIQDQASNWSRRNVCPPGLSSQSVAYRFGGYGSHETILYHEMVAHLLQQASDLRQRRRRPDRTAMIRQLEEWQQEWLHQPQPTLYDESPAAVIARERAHLPAAVPAGRDDLYDDCPLCQMMRDDPTPMFWHLDSYQFEGRFATSQCDSFAEWQSLQHDEHELPPAFSGAADDETLVMRDLTASRTPSDSEQRIWNYCFTNLDAVASMPAGEAASVLLFSVGACVGELLDDCRGQELDAAVAVLTAQFNALRRAARDRQLWAVSLAVRRFAAALRKLARQYPQWEAKCQDLDCTLDLLAEKFAQAAHDNLEAQS